jgi:hypothetical protein
MPNIGWRSQARQWIEKQCGRNKGRFQRTPTNHFLQTTWHFDGRVKALKTLKNTPKTQNILWAH